ncbi:methyl-accepting chemotaxis protein [Halobacterium noricense]|uniref:methyl-accepting chemotaxis protein n=1 Tax=Halobacterium noricense TaxID=223182 RepID=UPI001E5B58C2|nr:methyl-accepting chemotaxis protein [Halobacterium noricense]UHH26931.1 methyl-accepting chemotaxis protein [Halobacterium noricense]
MRRSLSSLPVLGTVVDVVRSSFRRKLTTALLVVFLIISIGTVGLYVQVGGLLEENVEQSMTAAAETEADELREWCGKNRLVTQLLSEHPVFEDGDRTEVREYLQAQQGDRSDTEIVRAYVIDRRNQTVAVSSDEDMESQPIEDLGWTERFAFQDFDDVQVTDPYAVQNETVIGFISPIRRTPEQLLVVEVDTATIFDRFEHPVDGGFTRVVNSNGTVVFSDDAAATLTQYSDENRRAPAVSSGLRGDSGFTESPAYETRPETEGEYVAAYAAVPNTDWVVIEHAPASEAYVITQQALRWIGGIAALTLLALVGVVGVLGRDVTGALSQLTDRAEQIEDGQYDVEFDTDRADEFGDLNRTIASTRDALQLRINEIRETQTELEASNASLEERSKMVNVLNRILRHNVRNEVNIITGRAELAASRIDNEAAQADLEAVQNAAWELSTISSRTQRIKQLLAEENTEPEPLDLDNIASKLARVDADTPCADVEFHDETNDVAVQATPTCPTAVADVVHQIATHNEGEVHVDVTVTVTDAGTDEEKVVLRIDDDADGLPELDVQAVNAGEETPLNHAEGLALWCLEWTVTKSDGELHVAPEDTTLKIKLPTASTVP